MVFPKEFLEIQLLFAQKVSEIKQIPLGDALFTYTSLPIRFGMSFGQLAKDNPIWIKFTERLARQGTYVPIDIIFQYHLEQMKDASPMRPQFGCFSYDSLDSEKGARIHFANNDDPEPGVLSEERIPIRMEELKNMFSEIKEQHPDFTFVISSSWLFNVGAFKRLFPDEFTTDLKVKANDYRSLGLWGQFIDKYGNVKKDLKELFIESMNKSATFEQLENSFPMKELKAEAELSLFYNYYQIF